MNLIGGVMTPPSLMVYNEETPNLSMLLCYLILTIPGYSPICNLLPSVHGKGIRIKRGEVFQQPEQFGLLE